MPHSPLSHGSAAFPPFLWLALALPLLRVPGLPGCLLLWHARDGRVRQCGRLHVPSRNWDIFRMSGRRQFPGSSRSVFSQRLAGHQPRLLLPNGCPARCPPTAVPSSVHVQSVALLIADSSQHSSGLRRGVQRGAPAISVHTCSATATASIVSARSAGTSGDGIPWGALRSSGRCSTGCMCCVAHHYLVETVRGQRCSLTRWHVLHCPSVQKGHVAHWQSGGTLAIRWHSGILSAVSAPQVRPEMVARCHLMAVGQWVPSVARLHP